MFKRLLIANRGEIAVRVARTARRMGVSTVAVYSDADRGAPHVLACDDAVHIGPAPAAESYLQIEKILDAVHASGAEAVHPGYGFLSENAAFADALEAAGVVFVGPRADTIRAMGSKAAAKDLMEAAGVPTTPGYQGEDQSLSVFKAEAERIGYPVLLKATAGGGGKGMRLVEKAGDLKSALESAQREAKSAFGDDRFLIEKYIPRARHVEVQIFGDGEGDVVHMFERDCSVQRRHQKVIEEAPAPNLPPKVRKALLQAGVDAGKAVDYRGAGTVEFLYDGANAFYFMEMNTRLQVEHPVSEMITGLDFVEWQLRVAAGEGLPLAQKQIIETGHAFEARLYAEAPANDFAPSIGELTHLSLPEDAARVDSGVAGGQEISPYYDPMIAKIITHAPSRAEALGRMRRALETTHVSGLETNTAFLHALAAHEAFEAGDVSTRFIEHHHDALFPAAEPGPAVWTAALLWAHAYRPRFATDPAEGLAGFRLNQPPEHVMWVEYDGQAALLRYRAAGEGFDVTLEPDASAAGRREGRPQQEPISFSFTGTMDGTGQIDAVVEGRTVRGFTAPHLDGLRIWLDGVSYDVRFPNPLAGSGEREAGGSSLKAPMPGLITLLNAAPGDTVAAGDPLLVLEAMKMEHPITAPHAGTVKSYPFQVGDQVREGDLLVEFEEAE